MKNTIKVFCAALGMIALTGCSSAPPQRGLTVLTAEITGIRQLTARFAGLPAELDGYHFSIEPAMDMEVEERSGNTVVFRLAEDWSLDTSYSFRLIDSEEDLVGEVRIKDKNLQNYHFNRLYTEKPLGMRVENGAFVFRLFAPRAEEVSLVLFDTLEAPGAGGRSVPMEKAEDGVFEVSLAEDLWGAFYGYRIESRSYEPGSLTPELPQNTVFADPYSAAVATYNRYPQAGLTLIRDFSDFDWQDDEWTGLRLEDAVILEAHLRDLTAHTTAEAEHPGTYLGVADARRGGIAYLKELGVNAVEFLPLLEFNNIEPPYGTTTNGVDNFYNAYAQNYWGYMTTNFFAPESYYASDGTLEADLWSGAEGRGVNEMKTMVRELHKEGIAVILDVVYNHVSDYNVNSLKWIDYDFYFKEEENTGCGNEVETRRLMARRLVLDSVRYWMEEYHVDGFRFDLAASHDPETIRAIYAMAREINPDVILIAEPWGGEGATDSETFIEIGWAKWNSAVRDVIRSHNRPLDEGTSLALGNNGGAAGLIPFWAAEGKGAENQQVHYIESHDDATFADILRIMSGSYSHQMQDGTINRIESRADYLTLSEPLLGASKVSAAALFLCQGPVMIHLGQEWGRGKITPDLEGRTPEVTDNGRIGSSSDNVVYLTPTPNSYNADNDTNYINFDEIALNAELQAYYRGLIALRASQPLLGNTPSSEIEILESENPNALGMAMSGTLWGFINADPSASAEFALPEGSYRIYVDGDRAGTEVLGTLDSTGSFELAPISSLIIQRIE